MGNGGNAVLGGTFFIAVFKEYLHSAIPKYKTIDGAIERLNRRTLATIFIIIGLLAMEEGLVGRRISCNGFKHFKKKSFVKDYCWTQGLFTNRYAYNLPRDSLPAPGIVPCIRTADNYLCSEEEKKFQVVYHLWYQWVPLYFLLSAVAFYAPYTITKFTILGTLSRFVDEMEKPEALIGKGGTPKKVGHMMAMWATHFLKPRYGESPWVQYRVPITVMISKLSFLVVSVTQFWLTAKMFPIGDYYQMGILWHIPSTNNYTHIGDVLFPKMAGCTIKKYGASGLNQESGMCNIAPNVVFQYFFLIMWWCVAVIIVLNVVNLLESVVMLLVKELWAKHNLDNLEVTYDNMNPDSQDMDNLYRGPTKYDTRLVFAYYDFSSQILLQKISDNVHPAIMSFGIKYLAVYIKEEQSKDSKLKKFLKDELEKTGSGNSSPVSSKILKTIHEQTASGTKLKKKGKTKKYKQLKQNKDDNSETLV